VLPFLLPLADVSHSATLEVRAETRGRLVENRLAGDKAGSGTFLDGELAPKGTYAAVANNGKTNLQLSYAPRIVWQNAFGSQGTFDTAHRQALLFQHKVSGRTLFTVASQMQYANLTLPTLLVQPRWDGGDRPPTPLGFPLPAPSIEVLSSYTSVGFYHAVSPRFHLQPSLYLNTYGGLDFEGRKNNPYLQNPALRIEGTYSITPTDDFIFDVQPQMNVFTQVVPQQNRIGQLIATDGRPLNAQRPAGAPEPEVRFVQLTGNPLLQLFGTGRYRHRFSPYTVLEAEAGVSATAQEWSKNEADPFNQRGGTKSIDVQGYPVAELYARTEFGTSSTVKGKTVVYTHLGPAINNITGTILRRIDNVFAFSATFQKNTILAQAAFLVSLPGEEFLFRQVVGELAYSRKITPDFGFDIGVRVGVQDARLRPIQPDAPQREFSAVQPGFYLGLNYRAPESKF
jgi:hypothetical protein